MMTKKVRTYNAEFKAEAIKKTADNNGSISATAKLLRMHSYANLIQLV